MGVVDMEIPCTDTPPVFPVTTDQKPYRQPSQAKSPPVNLHLDQHDDSHGLHTDEHGDIHMDSEG